MNKRILLGIILSCFILLVTPCINGINDVEIIESRNVNNISIIDGLPVKLLELVKRIMDNNENDCGCEDSIDWYFPLICSILLFLYNIVLGNLPFLFFAHVIEYIAGKLGGCPGIP
jgi:hypothetical protein